MKRFPILVSIFLALLTMFTNANAQSINSLSWLSGVWVQQSPKFTIYETWELSSDYQSLLGKGITLVNNDIVSEEEISITIVKGKLTYNVTVKNQNNGETIPFAATEQTQNHIVFENLNHDFPQKISYNKVSDQQLEVVISAIKNNKEEKIQFLFNRKVSEK